METCSPALPVRRALRFARLLVTDMEPRRRLATLASATILLTLVSCDGVSKRVLMLPAKPFADASSARAAYSDALHRAIGSRGFESRAGNGGGKWQTQEYHWRRQEDGNWLSVELRFNSETGGFDYLIKDWPRMTRSRDSKDIEQALQAESL